MNSLKIYYQDKDIIVVYKPPFIASQDDRSFGQDMVSLIKNHIYTTEKRVNPYVGVVHRLDKPVEGVMVYALNPKAAAYLSKEIAEHRFLKIYRAKLEGDASFLLKLKEGESVKIFGTKITCRDGGFEAENYMVFDRKNNISVVADEKRKDAKRAALKFVIEGQGIKRQETIAQESNGKETVAQETRVHGEESVIDAQGTRVHGEKSVIDAQGEDKAIDEGVYVKIELITGRHHQIRATMADIGLPVKGDRKYAVPVKSGEKHGEAVKSGREYGNAGGAQPKEALELCAWEIGFRHPASGKKMSCSIEKMQSKSKQLSHSFDF